jgi:hypothetical protein
MSWLYFSGKYSADHIEQDQTRLMCLKSSPILLINCCVILQLTTHTPLYFSFFIQFFISWDATAVPLELQPQHSKCCNYIHLQGNTLQGSKNQDTLVVVIFLMQSMFMGCNLCPTRLAIKPFVVLQFIPFLGKTGLTSGIDGAQVRMLSGMSRIQNRLAFSSWYIRPAYYIHLI